MLQTLPGYVRERLRRLQVEVLGGIDTLERTTFQSLRDHAWVELISLRLHRVLSDRIRAGGLDLPAPIVARIFAEISEGIIACTAAQKIAQISFPYPFFEIMRYIKWYFVLTVPLAIVSFTNVPAVAYAFSFLSSLFLVSLIEVSEELEDPFGEDANDLPLLDLHREFNEVLHSMFHERTLDVDVASTPACKAYQVRAAAVRPYWRRATAASRQARYASSPATT